MINVAHQVEMQCSAVHAWFYLLHFTHGFETSHQNTGQGRAGPSWSQMRCQSQYQHFSPWARQCSSSAREVVWEYRDRDGYSMYWSRAEASRTFIHSICLPSHLAPTLPPSCNSTLSNQKSSYSWCQIWHASFAPIRWQVPPDLRTSAISAFEKRKKYMKILRFKSPTV